MKFPLLVGLPTGGPRSGSSSTSKALGDRSSGSTSGQLQQLGQGDPSQALDYLRATGEVEEVGTEQIDGVETTHYRGTIQLDAVAEQVPAEQRERSARRSRS